MALTDNMSFTETLAWIEFVQWDRESELYNMVYNHIANANAPIWVTETAHEAAKAAKKALKVKHDENMQTFREFGGSWVIRHFNAKYRAEATKLWAKGWYWDKELEIMLNRP